MKRMLVLLLALVMLLSMCGCQSNPTPTETTKAKEIQLTVDNIEEYITLSFQVKDVERKDGGLYITAGGTVEFQAYSIQPGAFSNVNIVIHPLLFQDCRTCGDDPVIPSYKDIFGYGYSFDDDSREYNDSTEKISFTLPSSGNYSTQYMLNCCYCDYDTHPRPLKDGMFLDYTIISVTGTFIPS